MNNTATMSNGTNMEKEYGDNDNTPCIRMTPKACKRPASRPRTCPRRWRRRAVGECNDFVEAMVTFVVVAVAVEGVGRRRTMDVVVQSYFCCRRPCGQAETNWVVSLGGAGMEVVVRVTLALSLVGLDRHMFTCCYRRNEDVVKEERPGRYELDSGTPIACVFSHKTNKLIT